LDLVGRRFAKSSDEALVADAQALLRQADFRNTVLAALKGGEPETKQLVAEVRSLLSQQDNLTLESLDATLNAGQMLEYSGRFAQAKQVFAEIGAGFTEAEPALSQQAERAVRFAEKRIGAIGREATIQGVRPDGTPFDWAKWQGKVVLVDFWATWSQPWHEQLPELRATFDQFHEQGFEIVGVNLDESKDEVYRYLQQRGLPWPVVVDETVGGLANPNAIRYGVDVVPFAMLVGRDGKVAGIHVRGEALNAQVQALLDLPVQKTAQQAADLK
jgi:thiol-disulfide isomerase/thioredoxin